MLQMTTTYKLKEGFRKWLNYNRTCSKVKAFIETLEPTTIKNEMSIYMIENNTIKIEVGHKEIPKNTKDFELVDFFSNKKGLQPITEGIAIYSRKKRTRV